MVLGVDLADIPAELTDASNLEWIRGDVAAQTTWERVNTLVLRHDPRGAHCLIACAADVIVAPFLATTLEEWRRLLDTNVLGVIRGLQTLLPAMIARRGGAVAIVCSVNSMYAEDKLSAYSTSKAALLQVVRSAALEHARDGVRINAICPGAVETPMLRRAFTSLGDEAEIRRAVEKRTPTGKIIAPEEVAAVLLFAVSEQASAVSGAALVVDGGLTTAYDFDSLAVR
jgi:NAD(P)-dependent dehydrogenase (short-subunit alcohol dehydrogenase family)